MAKNARLARKILDSSWSTFKQMLQYKANRVVEVEPAEIVLTVAEAGRTSPQALAVGA